MQKISKLQAPALAGVVKSTTVRGAIGEVKNCVYGGASMIDLHMPCLESTDEESLRQIISASKIPVLALNYNNAFDGGDAGYTEEARIESFVNAVKAGAAGVDIQGYTYHLPSKSGFCGEDKYSFTKGNPKEIVTDEGIISKQCDFIEKIHSMGAEVLMSCHPGVKMNCEQVVELALYMEKRNPDIIKIVTKAEDEDDLFESIRAMMTLKKEVKTPVTYHVNGEAGKLSRIINPILGGHIAFCVERYNEASDREQIDLRTAREIMNGIEKIVC